jgi:hypothetical protein
MAPMLRQHGFEPPLHPFKRAAQFDDNGPVRQARTVHVVGYGRAFSPNVVSIPRSRASSEI